MDEWIGGGMMNDGWMIDGQIGTRGEAAPPFQPPDLPPSPPPPPPLREQLWT